MILESAIEWCRAEIFDAQMMLLAGVFIILFSLGLWKFSEAEHLRALIIPFCVVGVLLCSAVFGIPTNQKRIVEFSQAYEQNSIEFVQSEIQRVTGFEAIYKAVLSAVTVLMALAIALLWFVPDALWRGIALSLVLLSVSAVTVDYFSKARAEQYLKELYKEAL